VHTSCPHVLPGLCQLPYHIRADGHDLLNILHQRDSPDGWIYQYMDLFSTVLNLKIWRVTLSEIPKCFNSCRQQVAWLRRILNGGTNPDRCECNDHPVRTVRCISITQCSAYHALSEESERRTVPHLSRCHSSLILMFTNATPSRSSSPCSFPFPLLLPLGLP
jgi:hypothetical protein